MRVELRLTLGSPCDTEQLLALHDEVRAWGNKSRDPLRQSEGMVIRADVSTHNEARNPRLGFFQHERPRGEILPAGRSPSENQVVPRLKLCDDKHIFHTGKGRKYATHGDVLILWQNSPCTGLAAIVNEVVGVPSAATRSHLRKPRPHDLRRALDADGVCHRED